MPIIVLINIAIIICIYLRYYNFPKEVKNKKEDINGIDPIIIGYIHDRSVYNNYDLILSEIVNLNIKKYIIIEYDKNDKSKYNYTIKQNFYMEKDNIEKYDLIVLNFLFSKKSEITRSELEEKIIDAFDSYNVQYNELKNVLQRKLLEKSIVDVEKQEELVKFSKIYKITTVIIISLLLVSKIFMAIDISLTLLMMYLIEILAIKMLFSKASNYTYKGESIRNNIIIYKNEIANKEFLVDKKEMNEILLNKEFANSLALHINTNAKNAFISGVLKKATNSSKKAVILALSAITIIILAGIILQKVTLSLNKDGIVMLYCTLAIIVAFSTDIAFLLSIKKQK